MKLILLANGFPYGSWEPFLETETRYYGGFDEIHICAMQVRKEHLHTMRALPDGRFHVLCVPFAPMPVYLLACFRALFDKNLWGELLRLTREERFSLRRLAWLFFYVGRSHHEACIIRRYLRGAGVTGDGRDCLLYSYRFDYQPYTALLLKKQLPGARLVARAHRYDLYEEARGTGYIPLRPYLLRQIDHVFLIADDGLRYLAEKYPAYREKLSVSRLGTVDHGVCAASRAGGALRIVSCSTVSPVKRLHLIAAALSLITDLEIAWTHYGDGVLMPELRAKCAALPENISYELRGQVDNAALLAEYAETPYHLFLNVSSSEGVPVSIMEAMSFGIPCLATDVGGTAEIVNAENGALLPSDLTPEALAERIRAFAALSDADYQRYRAAARASWQENYDAEKNYAAFARELREFAEG